MLRHHHSPFSPRHHPSSSPRLCDSPGARRIFDPPKPPSPPTNASQPAASPPLGPILHPWTCRDVLLPWSLQPALSQAYEQGATVTFTLRTGPGQAPRTFTVDFGNPNFASNYPMVDEHGHMFELLSQGSLCRLPLPLPPWVGPHDPPATVLTTWPLVSVLDGERQLSVTMSMGSGMGMGMGSSSPSTTMLSSPTRRKGKGCADYMDVIEEYRFGLRGEDDFELHAHGHGHNAPPSHPSLVVDAAANRVEILAALLSHDKRVLLRSMGALWAPQSVAVRGGQGEMHKGVALHRLDPRAQEFKLIEGHFLSTAPKDTFAVASVLRIQNKGAAKLFAAVRSKIWAGRSVQRDVCWEELLWHGVSNLSDLEPLLVSTFRPYYSARQESLNAYGCGCYFSMTSRLADQYACEAWSVQDECPVRVMVLAHVIIGDATIGRAKLMPPTKPDGSSRPFDSFVDSECSPKLCVTTMDGQALQLYLVMYRRQWPSDGARVVSVTQPAPPAPSFPLAPPMAPAPVPVPCSPSNYTYSFITPVFASAPPSSSSSSSSSMFPFGGPRSGGPFFGGGPASVSSSSGPFGGPPHPSSSAFFGGGGPHTQNPPVATPSSLFPPSHSHSNRGVFGSTVPSSSSSSYSHLLVPAPATGPGPVFGTQASSVQSMQAFTFPTPQAPPHRSSSSPFPAAYPSATSATSASASEASASGSGSVSHGSVSQGEEETSASHVAALASPTRLPQHHHHHHGPIAKGHIANGHGPIASDGHHGGGHHHHHEGGFGVTFPPAGENDFENDPDL